MEYRWILTFNLTDLIKNLEGMILGLFVTKMVWLRFQVIGGNLEGNRCVASTNTRVCKYNFGGIKLLSRGSSMGPFNKLYCLAGNEEGLITNDRCNTWHMYGTKVSDVKGCVYKKLDTLYQK